MEEVVWLFEWLVWRLPKEVVDRQTVRFRHMWRALRGNAKPLMLCNIFWTVPACFMGTYLQLFMAEQGLTKVEIGTVASAQLAAQMAGALVGGFLAERLGRLRTVTIVDALCWPLAYLLFSTASTYLSFMLGAILVGAIFTLGPAWTALYVEGSPASRRVHLFGLLQMPWFLGNIIASLSGFLVGMWGVTTTCRVIFGGACAMTAFSVWFRSRYLRDPAPPFRPFRPSLFDVETLARGHWSALKTVLVRSNMKYIYLVQVLTSIYLAVGATYNFLFFADPRGASLPKPVLALLPLAGGFTVLLTSIAAVPLISLRRLPRYLLGSVLLMALSMLVYMYAPAGAVATVVLGVAAGSLGWGLFNPALNGYWANMMSDRERPRILAFTTVTSMLITMPAPTIAGGFYAINHLAPMVIQLACLGGIGALLFKAFYTVSPRKLRPVL